MLAGLLVALAAVGCGPAPSGAPTDPSPAGSRAASVREHAIDPPGIALSLPAKWLAFDEEELRDPDTRTRLEQDFSGAEGLFRAVAGQGERARILFLGVDPAARGSDRLAPTVTVVAVEPAIPEVGLPLAADFVVRALEDALEVETAVDRDRAVTPVGPAETFGLEHRIVDDPGSPGQRARVDGALVTAEPGSFLLLRNVAAEDDASTPSLDTILSTLRSLR